jgi:phenylalanyl-tRNA synthetase beta chain
MRRRAEDVMRDLGFDAVVTLSLVDPDMPGRLRLSGADPRNAPIGVSNPLSAEHSQLRTTLLGSLLDAARYNVARGAGRVALFESGRAYLSRGRSAAGGVLGGEFAGERRPPAFEPHCIAALAAGALHPKSWGADERPADFFAVKGVLAALARQLAASFALEPGEEPFLRPGRAARVRLGGAEAGWLGEVHPLVCRQWGLDHATAFQVELAELAAAASLGSERYEDVTTYPAVHQDLAIVVDEGVPAARVREAVLAGGGELLRRAEVFDLYRGAQVGEGRKSLALRLEFQAADRTLTDDEVAERRRAIKAALAEVGGLLRE